MDEKNPSESRKRRRSDTGGEQDEGESKSNTQQIPQPAPTGATAQAMAQMMLQNMLAQEDLNSRNAIAAAISNRDSMGNFSTQGNGINPMDRLNSERAAAFIQLLGAHQATSQQYNPFSGAILASLGGINPFLAATANSIGLGASFPGALSVAASTRTLPPSSSQSPAVANENSPRVQQPTPPSKTQDTIPAFPSALKEGEKPPPGPGCKRLYIPGDESKTSPYQCLARQQLEFFAARKDDLDAGAQGRNRPIELGQVGVRCIWCAIEPHRLRNKAFAYYPSKIVGIYQASQNIVNTHLCQTCHKLPHSIRQELLRLKLKKSGSGGGKKFWVESAESLGVVEVESGGLRYAGEGGNTKEDVGDPDKTSDQKPAAKK